MGPGLILSQGTKFHKPCGATKGEKKMIFKCLYTSNSVYLTTLRGKNETEIDEPSYELIIFLFSNIYT